MAHIYSKQCKNLSNNTKSKSEKDDNKQQYLVSFISLNYGLSMQMSTFSLCQYKCMKILKTHYSIVIELGRYLTRYNYCVIMHQDLNFSTGYVPSLV